MVAVGPTDLKALEDCLLNVSGKVPLHVRFRALFTLKGLKSDEAVEIISKGAKRGFDSHRFYIEWSFLGCSLRRPFSLAET